MDFSFSDSQRELAERISRFGREQLSRRALKEERFERARFRQLGEFGLLGLNVPEKLGGLGLDAVGTAHAMEAFGQSCEDFGVVFSAAAHLFACVSPLVHHGSARIQEAFVPGLARGELVGANAISEANAGSDVFALSTRAVRDGDEYVLDGVKTYVTNGPDADIFLVYAVTSPEDGLFGLSAFVVDRKLKGIQVAKPYEKHGLKSAPLAAVQFEGCRVPAWCCVGGEGRGRTVFTTSMLWERSCLFAGYLGAMQRQLQQVCDFARERKQFGKALNAYQAITHRIVQMKLRMDAAQLLTYRACWALDRGEASMEIALAKLAVSEAAVQSALDAVRIHGGAGVVADSGVGQALWETVPSLIFSGTSEMQHEIVARKLGL